jgi:hypothetical protein
MDICGEILTFVRIAREEDPNSILSLFRAAPQVAYCGLIVRHLIWGRELLSAVAVWLLALVRLLYLD